MGFRTFPTASIELKTWPEIAEAPSVKRPLGELALKRLPTSRFRNDAAILCTECPSTIFVTAVKGAKFRKVSRTQGSWHTKAPSWLGSSMHANGMCQSACGRLAALVGGLGRASAATIGPSVTLGGTPGPSRSEYI